MTHSLLQAYLDLTEGSCFKQMRKQLLISLMGIQDPEAGENRIKEKVMTNKVLLYIPQINWGQNDFKSKEIFCMPSISICLIKDTLKANENQAMLKIFRSKQNKGYSVEVY